MKSIKIKLIICFSALMLFVSTVFTLVSINQIEHAVVVEAEKALQQLALEGARLTESRIETQIRTLGMLARRSDMEGMDWEVQRQVLERQLPRTNFEALAVVNPDGTAFFHDGTIADASEREYVQRALRGEVVVSDVMDSLLSGKSIFIYAVPIENDGEIVGALIGRRYVEVLSEITRDMGFGEMGYAYMIDKEGTVIAHPNRDRVMDKWNPIETALEDNELQPVAEVFQTMIQEGWGVNRYYFEESQLYVGYAPIEGTTWILVTTANAEEVLNHLPKLQKNMLLISFVIFIISIVLCYIIGNSVTKPILATIAYGRKIAALNITEDVPKVFMNRKDEIGALAKAFQTITDNLREFIHQIVNASQQVTSSSQELSATSQQSATAADEIASTIESIAEGANKQAMDTEEGVDHINKLGELIEKDQIHMKDLIYATDEVVRLKEEGFEILNELVKKNHVSNKAAEEIHGIIIHTNENAQRIEKASVMIKNIADQTNLLALNAAIEAARAGESGKGFAVVAEEIRKLAEQSNTFTEEITTIIKELNDKTGYAVKTMEEVGNIVSSQTESVELTNTKFKGINNSIESMKEIIGKMGQSGEIMNSKKNEIIRIVQKLSVICQESAAVIEETSGSIEEQTASVEEIARASVLLAELADAMQESIAKFKYE
ncbi:MAG: methyl-accepting chemotaxis protein [Clostridiaceae bacterium]|nr:methyl-accepting chemotaxis protein [Clostridiaceae bacterium]